MNNSTWKLCGETSEGFAVGDIVEFEYARHEFAEGYVTAINPDRCMLRVQCSATGESFEGFEDYAVAEGYWLPRAGI